MSSTIPFKILMITSELSPLAKAGGLADMTGSLSEHLRALGHDVRVLLPAYRDLQTKVTESFPLSVKVGFRGEETICRRTTLPDTEMPVYLLDHPVFSQREGIYGNAEQEFFSDNGKRFALLSRAAFALMDSLDWYPDVIHTHDWPTALGPVYLNSLEKRTQTEGMLSVYTIHNIGYQGLFSLHDIHYTRLRVRDIAAYSQESPQELNYLKAGILASDIITTVSPQYAREIQTPEYGCGMEELLSARREDVFGILNGIDTDVWNPAADSYLPLPYSARESEGKRKAAEELRRQAGLPAGEKPIIGIVSRLVEQKGFHELCGPGENSLERIITELDCQVVILGTGEKLYEEELARLAAKYPNLSVTVGFSESLAHLIEGGSDFFLMPSRYEPCGLNQMYSLRYGTVPIVRKTGGLADTVVDFWKDPEISTGFVFNEISGSVIFRTVADALRIFREEPATIEAMRRRGMNEDFSWDHSAERYLELYQFGVNRKRKLVSSQ